MLDKIKQQTFEDVFIKIKKNKPCQDYLNVGKRTHCKIKVIAKLFSSEEIFLNSKYSNSIHVLN